MRHHGPSRFAVILGNRGFFPADLIAQARHELEARLAGLGHGTLMLPTDATAHGAVSNTDDAQVCARFLREHAGQYDGVILSLPNFGDEASAVQALKEVGVPILVHAYPDSPDRMAPEFRRDAFCGKLSVMDVFKQYGLRFTALKPHVVAPQSQAFAENIEHFDRVCRVVNGMRNMVVGAVGARTTAFKTVRIDELALQKNGITMEVVDLSEVMERMRTVDPVSAAYRDKAAHLQAYTTWEQVPADAFDQLVRLGLVLDELFEQWNLDAMGVRCWIELQRYLGISPCVILSEMNDRGLPVACEVDIGNAVAMYALRCMTGQAAACLDWNNNYGDDPDACILFHCGSTAQSLMNCKGCVGDHSMLQHDPQVGPNRSFGCNEGRIRAFPFGFASMATQDGRLDFYVGEGEFTDEPLASEFFGCGGVARVAQLQDVLLYVGKHGHRHHVSVSPGRRLAQPLREALQDYLGYDVAMPQQTGSGRHAIAQ